MQVNGNGIMHAPHWSCSVEIVSINYYYFFGRCSRELCKWEVLNDFGKAHGGTNPFLGEDEETYCP